MTEAPSAPDDPVRVPPMRQHFRLLTSGQDTELDVIHIAVEAFKQLDGWQIANVLQYLTRRYTRDG